MENNLSQKEALSILINAIELGQKRGVWKLDEAAMLSKAISTFTKPPSQKKELITVKEEEEY